MTCIPILEEVFRNDSVGSARDQDHESVTHTLKAEVRLVEVGQNELVVLDQGFGRVTNVVGAITLRVQEGVAPCARDEYVRSMSPHKDIIPAGSQKTVCGISPYKSSATNDGASDLMKICVRNAGDCARHDRCVSTVVARKYCGNCAFEADQSLLKVCCRDSLAFGQHGDDKLKNSVNVAIRSRIGGARIGLLEVQQGVRKIWTAQDS